MNIRVDALKCINCMACEMACSFHRDDGFAFLSSSIMAYRAREKKDYFGVLLKEEENLITARPEGLDISRIGEEADPDQEADASAKPILLREGCDLCEDIEGYGPLCLAFCPVDAITCEE